MGRESTIRGRKYAKDIHSETTMRTTNLVMMVLHCLFNDLLLGSNMVLYFIVKENGSDGIKESFLFITYFQLGYIQRSILQHQQGP